MDLADAINSTTDPAPAGERGPLPPELSQRLYAELRKVANRVIGTGRCPGLLQTTGVIHEAWLRLRRYDLEGTGGSGEPARNFAGLAASTLRSVLVDEARREERGKAAGWRRVDLCVHETIDAQVCRSEDRCADLLDLDAALTKLAAISERRAKVVELRFFAGLSVPACAQELGVGERTVESEWALARAFLRIELERQIEGVR